MSASQSLLSRLRVAIIGGGLSGVATASSLLKLGCSKVALYERSPSLPSLLSSHPPATVVSANGVRVLDALDALPSLRPHARALYRLTQRNHRGDLLSSFNPTSTLRSRTKDGQALTSLATPYPALHSALASSLPPSVLRFNSEVSAVQRSDSGFSLSLPSSDAHADLIVAADGADSTTRANFVHTRPTSPSPLGLLVQGIASHPLPPEHGKDELVEVWGNGQRFGLAPLTDGRLYWYATVNDHYKGQASSPAAFAATWDAFPGYIKEVIAATREADYRAGPLLHLPPTPPLHREGVVLVGSAACVLPPDYHQHAAQCLESALCLALSLRASPSLEEALGRYERLRLSRLTFVHSAAASEAESAVARSRVMSSLRDMASSLMPKQVSNSTYEAALGYNVLKEFPELNDAWQGGGGKVGAGQQAGTMPAAAGEEDEEWDEDEDDEEDEIAKKRNSRK